MNINFNDKLSSHLFHGLMCHEQHREQLASWLLRFFGGGWHNHEEEDFPLGERPQFDRQGGTIQTLYISASLYDLVLREDGTQYTSEFGWAVISEAVDEYGRVRPENQVRLINGGLINHGSFDAPDWSSHT